MSLLALRYTLCHPPCTKESALRHLRGTQVLLGLKYLLVALLPTVFFAPLYMSSSRVPLCTYSIDSSKVAQCTLSRPREEVWRCLISQPWQLPIICTRVTSANAKHYHYNIRKATILNPLSCGIRRKWLLLSHPNSTYSWTQLSAMYVENQSDFEPFWILPLQFPSCTVRAVRLELSFDKCLPPAVCKRVNILFIKTLWCSVSLFLETVWLLGASVYCTLTILRTFVTRNDV